jgi:plastocyanin
MRQGVRRTAKAQGFLTVLVVVAGMIAVAYVTVVWSGSQHLPTQQVTSVGNTTSTLPTANETSAQQGSPSPVTSFVKILLGSADSVSYSYSPVEVTVVIGVNNTVTWVNDDNAAHTVTSRDGSFGSGNIGAGGVYTYTFTTPGTYRYYCAYHSWMVGTVVVESG